MGGASASAVRSGQGSVAEPKPSGAARGEKGPSALKGGKKAAVGKSGKTPMAARADRHACYQKAVQAPEAEIDFVDETFADLRGRKASLIREDFCGTGHSACEWVRRRKTNRAIGLDIDQPTLDWGVEHNVGALPAAARERIDLRHADVMDASVEPVDAVLAMNFSYFLFKTRAELLAYFKNVRRGLVDGGLFFLDCYGGSEAHTECKERRKIDKEYTYIWEQHKFDPISHEMVCFIHFHFADGSKMNKAFEYSWRLWSLPEIRDMLDEAGFRKTTVYWEGEDEDSDEGNGEFEPASEGTADPAWICYVVAEK